MRRKIGVIIFITLLFCAVYSQSENMTPEGPESLIFKLYNEHNPQNGNGISFNDAKILNRYFTEDLSILFLRIKDYEKRTQEIGLDFDPIYNAQDYEDNNSYLNLEVKKISSSPKLRLQVTFTNLGRQTQIYEMKETKNGWRIDDIVYTSTHSSLRQILQEILSQSK